MLVSLVGAGCELVGGCGAGPGAALVTGIRVHATQAQRAPCLSLHLPSRGGGPSCKSLRLFPSQSTVKLLHQTSAFVKNAMHGEFLVNSSATPMGALPPSTGSGVLFTSPVSILHVEGGLNAPVLWGPDERQTSLRTKLRDAPHHPALAGDHICK